MNCSKAIFELMLDVMKKQLKLAEFGFGGKESEAFIYFKEQTMNHFYDTTKRVYQQGITNGDFDYCKCGASIRRGHKDCEFCGGSGYRDKEKKEE
jgi:NADH pyrophosphatase NudC (nudix superfamily)